MIKVPNMRMQLSQRLWAGVFTVVLAGALGACNPGTTPSPAKPLNPAAAITQTTIGDAVLQTQTVPLSSINAATARHYGIDTTKQGVMLLVTVRDAAGNALSPGDLQLNATASVLPDPPKPLPLRAIQTAGMTDYMGEVQAQAPASLQFKIAATRNGARAEMSTTSDLQAR